MADGRHFEILYTAADFELDERHVIKMKKLHRTDSEFDRTYLLFMVVSGSLRVVVC